MTLLRLPHVGEPGLLPQMDLRGWWPGVESQECGHMSPILKQNDAALQRAADLAQRQAGVASRRQLYALGITRWEIRARVRRGSWTAIGDQSVYGASGPLPLESQLWAAVFQGGPSAVLDGEAALVGSGLARWELKRIRVSVPRGARVRRSRGFDIRQTRRWSREDLLNMSGPPRTRPAVAAVRGALWATSDRSASYLLAAVVQQGIASAEEIGTELLRVRRDKRRRLLHGIVNDLVDGARSLGELDVAEELRRRGLPAPEQQVLRHDGAQRYYLDLRWQKYRTVVEVDGIQHHWVENIVADALRQNAVMMQGDTVLRLPLLGLRVQPDAFFAQIERALRANGWSPSPNVMRSVG